VDGSLPFYFTGSNKNSIKNKKGMCREQRRERETTDGSAWGVPGSRSEFMGLAGTWKYTLNFFFYLKI